MILVLEIDFSNSPKNPPQTVSERINVSRRKGFQKNRKDILRRSKGKATLITGSTVIFKNSQIKNKLRLNIEEVEDYYEVLQVNESRTTQIKSKKTGKTKTVSVDSVRVIS